VVRVSVKNPLPDGVYVDHETIWRASGGARSAVARIGGIGSLRGLHKRPECGMRIGLRARARCLDRCLAGRSAQFSGSRAPHGTGRPPRQRAVRQRLQGHPMRTRPRMRWSSFRRHILDRRGKPKLGGITSLSEYFPRIRKAYLIGEAAPEFAPRSEPARRTRFRRRSMSRWRTRRATRKPRASPMPWCCCRRPAPRSTSTPQFRDPRRALPRPRHRAAWRQSRCVKDDGRGFPDECKSCWPRVSKCQRNPILKSSLLAFNFSVRVSAKTPPPNGLSQGNGPFTKVIAFRCLL